MFSKLSTPITRRISFGSAIDDFDAILSSFESNFERFGLDHVSFPPSEMIEQDNTISVNLAVAGFKKEQLDVQFDSATRNLTITGTRAVETDETDNKVVIYSKIAKRNFTLSQRISREYDETTLAAKLEDGILSITFTKKEKEEPSSIKVTIA